MSAITIEKILLNCGEGRVVVASDGERRPMLGVSPCEGHAGSFVQIDRVTVLDLQRGAVDLRTAMTERCAGIVVPG
jgi:hypothetical protein